MKFAANGTLYRGSKPVMWSVVEKTALAEAEVEYEDYTSDTVWVKFPVASAPARRERRSRRRFGRHLDDDAVDAAGQPRHQLFAPRSSYGLYEVADAPPTTGRGRASSSSWPMRSPIDVFRQARVDRLQEACATSPPTISPASPATIR